VTSRGVLHRALIASQKSLAHPSAEVWLATPIHKAHFLAFTCTCINTDTYCIQHKTRNESNNQIKRCYELLLCHAFKVSASRCVYVSDLSRGIKME